MGLVQGGFTLFVEPAGPFKRFPVIKPHSVALMVHIDKTLHRLGQTRFRGSRDELDASINVQFDVDSLQIGQPHQEVVERVLVVGLRGAAREGIQKARLGALVP